ncbi:MAG: hypothetical protein WA839_10635 [Flavobacteriaceae bacterium]|tara:strand:- start:3405 stop:4367 length:963 start_codon:yes stop_codon:yes gene_type:complete
MRLENIEIENKIFTWGETIDDMKSMFSTKDYFENENQHSQWKTIRFKISNQWNINCNSCEFSSPNYDRLINRFHINLGVIQDVDSLMDKLDKVFGKRTSDTTTGDNYGSGSVIRNCKWDFDNCGVGISIFGGERIEHNESNFGTIYFHLTDLELINKLYSSELVHKNQVIESNIANNDFDIEIFTLRKKQWLSWGIEKNNYPDYDGDFISMTFNSLYNRALLKTPSVIRTILEENEICIFKDPVTSKTYIANHWESYLLNDSDNVSWLNTLPAKGSGNCLISIGDFRINDEHSQNVTKKLIKELENILHKKIKCHKDYDC